MTIEDRIKTMNRDELARFIASLMNYDFCELCTKDEYRKYGTWYCCGDYDTEDGDKIEIAGFKDCCAGNVKRLLDKEIDIEDLLKEVEV